ncbi:uncharacterized protein LOC117339541 [Pecten maximus]|uniref:uncharacterized protein LOC117339541 n=1 Tax=Pecten maximus TaxID=6579 RepID=UPI00145878B3|nr:uncharacterized protein LOC117339541 [Pecten maximus]
MVLMAESSLAVKLIYFLSLFVVTGFFTFCILTLCKHQRCLLLFHHYKKLISFYWNAKKWRKTIDKFVGKEESIETFKSYIVGNLGSGVDEKTLIKTLLPLYRQQKAESDVVISITLDPKNTSLRKALVQVPFHCTKACNLLAYNNVVLNDRKISVSEIKKRKHLLRKDFKLVSPEPSVVSVGERDSDNGAWKMNTFSEYQLIDGGNRIIDIDRRLLSGILANSDESGICAMVLTCSNFKQIKQAVKLCEQYPGYMYFTAGVHPSEVKQWNDDSLDVLEKYAEHPQCVAIGECGLQDSNTDTNKQVEIFRHQIELACKLKKPLWFCSLGADDKLIPILHEYKDKLTGMCVGEYIPSKVKKYPHRIPRFWELIQMGSFVSVSWFSKEGGGYDKTWFRFWLQKGYISPYQIIFTSNAPSTGVPNTDYEGLCSTLSRSVLTYLQESTMDNYYNNSSEVMDGEPSCLPALLEIISSFLDCPPKKLASITTSNAQKFFNFK